MQHRLTAALCRQIVGVDAHLSGTDSGATRVNTPALLFFVLLAAAIPF